MKKMKLATKISLGFGLLIIMAVALGGMAVYNMSVVTQQAQSMEDKFVPEVDILSQLERRSQRTMFNMRGYAMSENKSYLELGRKDLALVKESLAAAQDLVTKYPELEELKKNIGETVSQVNTYGEMADQTVAGNEKLAVLRVQMDEAATTYMNNCNAFLSEQNENMKKGISSGAEQAILADRLEKITIVNDIITLGNEVRVQNYKSQATWDPSVIESALSKFHEMDEKFNALRKITRQEKNLKQIDNTKAAANKYKTAMSDFLETWKFIRQLDTQRGDVANNVLEMVRQTSKAGIIELNSIARSSVNSLTTASLVMIIGLIVAVVFGVLLAVFITLSITKPIKNAIAGLSDGSSQVASAAMQVSNSSQSLAQGAAEQAASLEETSSSMEEMSSMTRKNAENANEADGLSKDAQQVVQKANQAMGELTVSMEEISKAGEETSKIIKTIDEIAFQTNLLALNAAVEAARAGEAGAGFAVVADEVRNLAMRAAEAAKNTAGLIEGTIQKTSLGAEIVARTNQAFAEVAESTTKVGELVSEIAAASVEQDQGIGQVNKAMGEMDKVTQQNAANAEESAAASEELSAQAETMQSFVHDLAALVEGAKNGNASHTRQQLRPAKAAPMLPGPKAKKKNNPPAPQKATPAEAIPFDNDEDFGNF